MKWYYFIPMLGFWKWWDWACDIEEINERFAQGFYSLAYHGMWVFGIVWSLIFKFELI